MSELKQSRLETGTLRTEGDWPGVFIRGDNALIHYVPHLEAVLGLAKDFTLQGGSGASLMAAQDIQATEDLLKLLRSCQGGDSLAVTNDLKDFEEIKK